VSAVNLPELVAELMHDAYELAAVRHGWATQERSRVAWADLPEPNKMTMLDAVRAGLAPIIDALPVCPTCDGSGGQECTDRRHYIVGQVRRNDVHDDVRCPRSCMEFNGKRWLRCPDCTDGRMDVFRALAIARAVMECKQAHPNSPDTWKVAVETVLSNLRAVTP